MQKYGIRSRVGMRRGEEGGRFKVYNNKRSETRDVA